MDAPTSRAIAHLIPARRANRRSTGSGPTRAVAGPALWCLILTAVCLGSAVPAVAGTGDPAAAPRPRVGLALSGGGARGFSHVGVLRALEKLRVPIDCIAGTSAGAAVGAAYAVGLAPDVIEARLRQADWDGRMFSDRPARPELPYRDKSRLGGEALGVTLGVGADGLRGSTGIFGGQQIELFLHRLLGVSTELASFDLLPVPFRATATDLVSGQLAVQRQGSLVHAVQASMAVPSAFAPVRIGNRLLVDGGLTQNLPVQTARQACAEVVIAVNIGSPLLGADDLNGVFAVGLQVISILMDRNLAESTAALRPQDVLIAPDLSGVSAVDFARGVDGIPAGERATLAAAAKLAPLALAPEAYAAWQRDRLGRVPAAPAVDTVTVAPTRFVDPAFFALGGPPLDRAAAPVDTDALERRIAGWGGSGHFTNIAYSVRPTRSGHTLWIDAHEKPWGPDYLQIGVAGQADSGGYADFSVEAALRRTWLNRWGGEWLTIARFGRTRELESSFFQPLGPASSWFVEPRLRLMSTPLRIFVADRAVGELRLDRREAEVAAGWQAAPGMVRLGLVSARIRTEPVTGLLLAPGTRAEIDGWRATLAYDRLDDLELPREGQAVRLDSFRTLHALGAATGYGRDEASAELARSNGPLGLRLRGRWARVASDRDQVRDFVSTGGFLDLSGYQAGQFSGRELAYLSLGITRRLLPLPQPFGSGLFAGAALELARIRQPLGLDLPALTRRGLALYVGAATTFGPAYLGIGLGQDGNRALYLMLGRP